MCRTLARGKQQAGYQHRVTSCEQDQSTAPPALAEDAVRDQLGRGGADGHRFHCLCTALSFPRVSVSGARGQAQSVSVPMAAAAQCGQPGVAASKPAHRTPGDTLGTVGHACSCPGFGGGSRDASAACRAWQRSNHLDRVATAAIGARAARLEPRW